MTEDGFDIPHSLHLGGNLGPAVLPNNHFQLAPAPMMQGQGPPVTVENGDSYILAFTNSAAAHISMMTEPWLNRAAEDGKGAPTALVRRAGWIARQLPSRSRGDNAHRRFHDPEYAWCHIFEMASVYSRSAPSSGDQDGRVDEAVQVRDRVSSLPNEQKSLMLWI
jgi:hypothetical protein